MSNTKTVLILGGGTMQIPAIRAAKKKGWTVIVADGNPESDGRSMADHFFHVDLKDKETMAAEAGEYQRRIGLDGIFTAGTDFSTTVAYVAQSLGLPGIGYEAALDATDKARMRGVFSKHGVPSPRFVVLDRNDDPLSALVSVPLPVVIKPVDNMGSRGVRRIDSAEELVDAFETAVRFSRAGRAIVEEYIEGDEYSIDALVWNGNIRICGLAIRHIFFPPYFVEMGHTIPAPVSDEISSRISDVFRRGIRALGITIGAAKGDIRFSKHGPVIGEIAARLSGGYMSGWTYPYSSGVDLTAAALNLAVGLDPGDLNPSVTKVSAERAFISLPGKIGSIRGFDEASRMPRIKEAFLRVREGDPVVFPRNNVEKCGNLIAVDETHEGAIHAAENAIARIVLRLEPDVPETDAFIIGNWKARNRGTVRFHTIADADNIAAFNAMPEYIIGEKAARDPDFSFIPLPDPENEPGTDACGRRLAHALTDVLDVTGIVCKNASRPGSFVLGKVFWKALCVGGAQAAIYLIDTLRTLAVNKSGIERRLQQWRD